MKSGWFLLSLFIAYTFICIEFANAGDAGVTRGQVQVLQIGIDRGYGDAQGFGTMVRTPTSTVTSTRFGGLLPNTEYPSHVHVDLCANGAGGHYKIDPNVADTAEDNEMWVGFTTNEYGIGGGFIRIAGTARPEAKSIIVHDPVDKKKLLCIDLAPVK